MKFIKLHKYGRACLVKLSDVSEVYTTCDNNSCLFFNFEADGMQASIVVDESLDEILELIKQVSA